MPMGRSEDEATLVEMLEQYALDWLEALGAWPHPWAEAILGVAVFPQPDGQVQLAGVMRAFWSEPAAGRHATVASLFPIDESRDDDGDEDEGRRLVRSHALDWMTYASPDALPGIVNLMVDVHGMTPSLLWVQATDPAVDRVSIGQMPGDHSMGRREVDDRTVLLTRHTTAAPWLTSDMLFDVSVLHHWVMWSGGRPQDPTGAHVDGVADVEATREWRTYWAEGLDVLEPEMLARLSAEQAVAMVLDDWLLVLHRYSTIDEQVLACRPSNRVEDPAGASRVLPQPRHDVDWADTPTADGQWVVVTVDTYDNWDDDDREGRCWAEMTPSMRHQMLTEAFESAVVFTSVMNLVEWAGTLNAMGTAPLDWRVELLAALVDLPITGMDEVRARLATGVGNGIIDHLQREWDPYTQDVRFPVFVHNIPGRPQRAEYEPPTEGTEYHLYCRDRDWLAWAGPMRAAAADLDAALAFAAHIGGDETRMFEVRTRPIPIPPTPGHG